MPRGRRERLEPFADALRSLPGERESSEPDEGPQAVSIVNLAQERQFTDAHGVVWRRRGDILNARRLQRLLRSSQTRLLHDYLGAVTEVPIDEREAFWAAAQTSMSQLPRADFYGAEFKNDEGEHLLVVHEDC